MPLTMSQIEHAEKTINKAGKIVSNYTYPFFIIAANNKPDLVGTAVIVNYMSANYLITASHVLAKNAPTSDSSVHIGTGRGFLNLTSKFFKTKGDRDDSFDIAFYKLSESEFIDNELNCVPERYLLSEKKREEYGYTFTQGFPCNKNKQGSALKEDKIFNSKALTYAGLMDDNYNSWVDFRKSDELHYCMNYGKAENVRGIVETPVKPIGFSGGGLWGIPDLMSPNEIYLLGIFIEYYSKASVSFSTRIDRVLEFISDNT